MKSLHPRDENELFFPRANIFTFDLVRGMKYLFTQQASGREVNVELRIKFFLLLRAEK